MATDLRAIIFQALRADPEIAAIVGDRIYQRGSWGDDGTPPTQDVPYLVYQMSDEAQSGPSILNATRRYFAVWAHDEIGDYYRIDALLDQIKIALTTEPQQGKYMETRFLLKSPDLYDDMLKHIVRYGRFYATLTE